MMSTTRAWTSNTSPLANPTKPAISGMPGLTNLFTAAPAVGISGMTPPAQGSYLTAWRYLMVYRGLHLGLHLGLIRISLSVDRKTVPHFWHWYIGWLSHSRLSFVDPRR